MNGRMYDAVLGRFLSPDNYVQDPYNTQSFNRYGYVWNNPLNNSDPSGEFLVSALIGAAIGVITNGISNLVNNRAFFEGAGSAALYGAIGGAVSFGIGEITKGISNAFLSGVFQISAHGLSGGILANVQGGKFGAGFLSGSISSIISTSVSSVKLNSNFWSVSVKITSSGLSGGLGSLLGGGKFLDGVRQGLISGILNHGVHSGWFGINMQAAVITGRIRHLFGPDATILSGSAAAGFGLGLKGEKGALFIERGKDKYQIFEVDDVGVGGSTPSASAGVSITRLYYSGNANFDHTVFLGNRWETNIGVDALIGVGVSAIYSEVPNSGGNFVIGVGITGGVGISLTILDININLGKTTRTNPWKK